MPTIIRPNYRFQEPVHKPTPKVSALSTPMLTTREVSAFLKVSVSTVRNLVTEGELPQPLKVGKQWRFSQQELTDWLKASQEG